MTRKTSLGVCKWMTALALLAGCEKASLPVDSVAPEIMIEVSAAVLRTVRCSTAAQISSALSNARAGDSIVVSAGTYSGVFATPSNRNGNSTDRIVLQGIGTVVFEGSSTSSSYGFHLRGDYWNLRNITLRRYKKGLIADDADNCLIDAITVTNIGEEGIHLRTNSTNTTVQNCNVNNVGKLTPDYGEGIYVGSAKSNWADYTGGNPDRCDNNKILNNTIGPNCTAECIDIKEGTSGGLVKGNRFDATGITGANSANSFMDVKGNNWSIENNSGTNPSDPDFEDGFQVNRVFSGWGNNNIFKANTLTVNAPGYGINIRSGSLGTPTGSKVYASNSASGAARGLTNITITL